MVIGVHWYLVFCFFVLVLDGVEKGSSTRLAIGGGLVSIMELLA